MINIYDFFATCTRLPVEVDEVETFLRSRGAICDVRYCPVDIDPSVLLGMFRLYEVIPKPYSSETSRADILYSARLAPEMQRLVVCKELLHIADSLADRATSKESVELLLEEVAIPGLLPTNSSPAKSDKLGLVSALRILFPRDAIIELGEPFDNGQITIEEIAKLVHLPSEFVEHAMGPRWRKFVDAVT